jgi:hypothetical protein
MAKAYGGVSEEDKGKAAYKALVAGGSAGFHALLGGGRSEDGQYVRMDISYCTAIVTVFDDTPSILRLNGTAGPGVIVAGTSAFT